MLRIALAGAMALVLVPAAHAAVDCSASAIVPPPLPATVIEPVAMELYSRPGQLGMPSGVLAPNASGEQSLERVLMRLRVESCNNVASAMPARPAINPNDPAAYKPQTQYDNTPWRFDMSQNGKRMTADEFDAWMKARGVRVVKAAATPAAEGAAEAKAAAEVK